MYLHREPIDMRTGRNGLAALVREGMQHDPFAPEALYVFVGRRYDMLKILGWDRNGYAIWSKKIESDEKFRWPRMLRRGGDHVDGGAVELAARWLRCVVGAASDDPIYARELSAFFQLFLLSYLFGAVHFNRARAEQKSRSPCEQNHRAVRSPECLRRANPAAA